MISRITCYCFHIQYCTAIDLSYFRNSIQYRSLYEVSQIPQIIQKKDQKLVIRVEVTKTIVVKESKSIC